MAEDTRAPTNDDGAQPTADAESPRPLVSIADLTPDPSNANLGTDRGREAIAHSLREYGAGRSVLADREGRLIAGNKTVEQATALGFPIRVIETDGDELIVVRRTDLDLARDQAARELAFADNRSAELGLNWDPLQIHAAAIGLPNGLPSPLFTSEEVAALLATAPNGATARTVAPPLMMRAIASTIRDEILLPLNLTTEYRHAEAPSD